ncbi:hypothetical protein D3C86_1644630 [compost metagenome]
MPAVLAGEKVVVDFSGITSVPSAFVNSAFIRLLEHVTFRQVRDTLSFVQSTRQINQLIRSRFDFVAHNTGEQSSVVTPLGNQPKEVRSIHFDLKRSGTQFTFNLKAGNGEIVLTSERYTTKQSAQSGIAAVKVNAPSDARYRKLTATNGSSYFTLTGANGETIGTSETYSSTSARDNGISWVKLNAPGAPTADNT